MFASAVCVATATLLWGISRCFYLCENQPMSWVAIPPRHRAGGASKIWFPHRFPLRCPMHHAGCTTNISDLHARRVLGRKEYRKFVDFYDRSVLGEGIHCLKCGSFVNLPRDGDPMVQCPYCAYRWCVRCKCPWHPNIKCSERADVEVEEWREAHGAQRCPGCFKLCIN